MHPRTPQILIFPAILLIHLLFFTFALIRPPEPLPDSIEYLDASGNIFRKGTLYCGNLDEPIREELFTRRPPLYPLLLGIAVISGSTLPVLLLQTLFSLLSILMVAKIFLDRFPSRRNLPHLLLLIFLLATPAQFVYANRIMAEIPFQLILVLMAWCVYRYFESTEGGTVQSRRYRYVWFFFILLSLGMAIKPVLFPFVIPAALFSLFASLRTKKWVWLVGLLIPLLWITAYKLYNLNRTGSSQYSSIQTANLVNYNYRYFIMSGKDGEEASGAAKASGAVDALYDRCGNEPDYAGKNKCLSRGVRSAIIDEPLRYILFHLKGSLRYFLDPGRFDLVTFFNLSPPDSEGILQAMNEEGLPGIAGFLRSQGWGWIFLLGFLTLFKLLKFTGLILFLFRGNNDIPLRIFIGLLIGYLALVTGPLGASRFLLPVELLMIGASLKGWFMLWSWKDRSAYSSSIL